MNIEQHINTIANELNIKEHQVTATISLLDEGGTVPFIARYRKERTGSLDEVQVTDIRDRLQQLRELDERRATILKSIKDQEKLTPELEAKIKAAQTMTVLEDLYLPYKPKRRTRATIAREKGLEPLAEIVFQQEDGVDPKTEAEKFINKENDVKSTGDALSGAKDIIAEWVNENIEARQKIRSLFLTQGVIKSTVNPTKKEEGKKFKDYFEWEEPVAKAPSHRILAMRRGEKEKVLVMRIVAPEDQAVAILTEMVVKANNACGQLVKEAVEDAYKRLLAFSMENEIRLAKKQEADEEAIKVFAVNLRQLLMAAPLGQKNVMAVDPGLRTGCKIACLDAQGKFLHHDTVYPHQSDAKTEAAAETLKSLCQQYKIEIIAIGNGTAGRETETFIRSLKIEGVRVVMVSESGASIYSASPVAREEFPKQDITVRGAISIGRRLQDPLAELVKIDPKNIGVGQYQHDVNQKHLKKSLDDVVVSSVNQVGVELNTASKQLLTYVSGLGSSMAKAIVDYREKHGAFNERTQLKEVSGLGDKAFEQAAGFLRISEAKNPLDASAVHPERYALVDQMAKDVGCTVEALMKDSALRDKINLEQYVTDDVGLPTLKDILEELAKPGRDPRDEFEMIEFNENVHSLNDLEVGMELVGVVTNLTNFGAFVDVGVHHDGLIHISEMSDKFIKNPADVLAVQQKVDVVVKEIDQQRQRIALTMKSVSGKSADKPVNTGSNSKKPEAKAKKLSEKDLQSLDLFGNRSLQKKGKRKDIYKSL